MGSCSFATRVVGSLGRLVTACGACGRMEILGDLLGSCCFLCGLAAIRGELVATRGVSWGLVGTRGDSRGLVLVLFPYWGESSLALPGLRSSAWCPWRISPLSCVLLALGRLACSWSSCLASCPILITACPLRRVLVEVSFPLSWVWSWSVRVASWSCSCPGLSLDFVRSWVVLGQVAFCLLHRLRLRGRSLHCSLWLSRLVLPCWPAAGSLLARMRSCTTLYRGTVPGGAGPSWASRLLRGYSSLGLSGLTSGSARRAWITLAACLRLAPSLAPPGLSCQVTSRSPRRSRPSFGFRPGWFSRFTFCPTRVISICLRGQHHII